MKIDVTLWNLLQREPILGDRGIRELKELIDSISDISGDSYSDAVNSLEEFIEDSYGDDGDAFINSLLYANSELLDDIQEYFGAESADEKDESYSLRNEAYTNFKRWASDIARNSVNYDWKVAGSRGNKDYPQWIWRDDLWVKKGDYSVSFSLAPDGDTVAFNIFKGDKFPLTRVFSKHCSKSDLADVVNEVEGKIPADLFKEVRTVLRAYRFK